MLKLAAPGLFIMNSFRLSYITALYVMAAVIWAPALTSIGDANLNILIVAILALGVVLGDTRSPTADLWHGDDNSIHLLLFSSTTLALLGFLSILWAEEPMRVFRVVYAQLGGAVVMMFFLRFPMRAVAIRGLVRFFIWGGVASAAFAMLGFLLPNLKNVVFGASDRTAAFFKQSNQLGIALALIAPLAFGFSAARKGATIYGALLCGSIYLGLALSGSKTNLLLASVTIGLLIFLVLICRRTFSRAPHVAVAALAAVCAGAVLGYIALEHLNPRAKRLIDTFAEEGDAPSVTMRQDLWAWSLNEGLKRPFTGMGAGQAAFDGRFTHSHNVFIDYFRTLGIFGLALITLQIFSVLFIVCRTLVSSIGNETGLVSESIEKSALALSLVSYILSNQTSDSFGPSTIFLFWLCLGLLIAYRRISSRQ